MGNDARPAVDDIAPFRRAIDDVFVGFLDRSFDWLAAHWLALVNAGVAAFALLPVLAPYLMSVGLRDVAQVIYVAYSYTCHQLPERSFFVFGYQMAYCQRDVAIYVAALLAGLAFGLRRDRRGRMSFRLYLLLIAPMALDGFTQLFGWRESTWFLRTVTGGLFGAACVWLAYPYVQRAIDDPRV